MKQKALILYFSLLSNLNAFASHITLKHDLYDSTFYNDYKFASVISKENLTKTIQSVISKAYMIGFKKFSDDDFYHGHLVFEQSATKPFAMLFHTQEHDLFNANTRNWLTRLDKNYETQNALKLRYSKQTHPDPLYDPAHTIVHQYLDPAKIGKIVDTSDEKGYNSTYQTHFRQFKCKGLKKTFHGKETTHFEVFLPSVAIYSLLPNYVRKVCLQLGGTRK